MTAVDVQVSPRFRELRGAVERLVGFGVDLVADQPVEVHVRARHPRVLLVLLAPPVSHGGCMLLGYEGAVAAAWCRAPLGLPPPTSGRPMRFAAVARSQRHRAARLTREAALHDAQVVRWTVPSAEFTGRAYDTTAVRPLTLDTYRRRLRPQPRVAAGVRALITLRIPVQPHRVPGFPLVSRYRAKVPVELADWREAIIRVAAHEADHACKYLHGLPAGEVDAERWAVEVLRRWRTNPRPLEDAGGERGQLPGVGT